MSSTNQKRFPFTQPRLEALACPPSGRPERDGKLWVYDDGEPRCVPGLCCCITEGGSRTFYWYRKVDGKPIRFRLGKLTELTVDNARNAAKAQNREGGNPQAKKTAAKAEALKESATLGNLWASYLEHWLKNKKPQTVKWCTKVWESHLAKWSDRALDGITSADIEKLKGDIGEMPKPKKRKAGATGGKYIANRVLELLNAIFRRRGHAFGLVRGFSPVAGVDRYPEKARDRVLSVEELGKILNAIDVDENGTASDYFRMLLYTGMRRANVASMEFVHIDGGLWRIPGAKTKSGNPLQVTLIPDALAIINRRLETNPTDSPYVFTSRNFTPSQVEAVKAMRADKKTTRQIADATNLSQTAVMHILSPLFKPRGITPFSGAAKAWRRILERAGITNRTTLHDVRRTFATALIERGVPLPIVAEAMGHRDLDTTMRHYAHASHKAVADATRDSMAGLMADVAKAQEKTAAKSAKTAG